MVLKVGVTGGNGFIGKRIVNTLKNEGIDVVSLQRSKESDSSVEIRYFDLKLKETINKNLLIDLDIVIHIAGLAHDNFASEKQHNDINYEATKNLFNLAKLSSVKKFIFISTVAVYGLDSCSTPIDVNTITNPKTPYAKAKLMSESYILDDNETDIIVSVIRLPLVCGENAPGNFGFLEKISKTKLPLPFGITENKRSTVSVELVANVLLDAVKKLEKYNGLQILADSPPVSTKEMIVKLRKRHSISPNLIPIPKFIMKTILSIIGKKKVYNQLYEDLVFISSINIGKYNYKN